MQRGRLVETGYASQVLHAPRERYTAELLAAIPRGLTELHTAT